MANFLRRFVEKSRSKSRSKSPTKRAPQPVVNHEFDDHWQHAMAFDPHHSRPPMLINHQKMPPMIRTQYVDERAEVGI